MYSKPSYVSFDLCRKGTRINVFGVIIPGEISVSPAEIHFLETRVDASFSVTPKVMFKSMELMKKRIIVPDKIVTHRYKLSDINKALDGMEFGDRIKIVINP